MILIFTGNEQLDRDLSKRVYNSRIVYYADYILKEKKAKTLITTIQANQQNFKEFMFKVREKDIQVILLLENESVKELKDALMLGIYDMIFDPFDLEDIIEKIRKPNTFSKVTKYMKNFVENNQ